MARAVAVVVLLVLAASGCVATRAVPTQKPLEGLATGDIASSAKTGEALSTVDPHEGAVASTNLFCLTAQLDAFTVLCFNSH